MRFRERAASESCASLPWAVARGAAARVIYFYGGEDMPVYALLAYAKSAKTDLSPLEGRAVRAVVTAIKSAGKERR